MSREGGSREGGREFLAHRSSKSARRVPSFLHIIIMDTLLLALATAINQSMWHAWGRDMRAGHCFKVHIRKVWLVPHPCRTISVVLHYYYVTRLV